MSMKTYCDECGAEFYPTAHTYYGGNWSVEIEPQQWLSGTGKRDICYRCAANVVAEAMTRRRTADPEEGAHGEA